MTDVFMRGATYEGSIFVSHAAFRRHRSIYSIDLDTGTLIILGDKVVQSSKTVQFCPKDIYHYMCGLAKIDIYIVKGGAKKPY